MYMQDVDCNAPMHVSLDKLLTPGVSLSPFVPLQKELEELFVSEHAKMDKAQADEKEGGGGSGEGLVPPGAAL